MSMIIPCFACTVKDNLLLSGPVLKVCLSGRGRMLHVLSAKERQVPNLRLLTIPMAQSALAVMPLTHDSKVMDCSRYL